MGHHVWFCLRRTNGWCRALGARAWVIGAVLVLSLTGGALGAASSNVVPRKGKVAGEGYPYWLIRSWQNYWSSAKNIPCQTLTANGQSVAYLELLGGEHTCSVPVGRPLYVDQANSECDTFYGDHTGYGTSDSQLKECARAHFKGTKEATTIDGNPVNLGKLVAATDVFTVHEEYYRCYVIDNNLPCTARAVAYGYGLLVSGFPKGTHTVHSHVVAHGSKFDITFKLHVH